MVFTEEQTCSLEGWSYYIEVHEWVTDRSNRRYEVISSNTVGVEIIATVIDCLLRVFRLVSQ